MMDDYVGLSLGEADVLAAKRGEQWRVRSVDGSPKILTRDYKPGRINFDVVDGLVVKVSLG